MARVFSSVALCLIFTLQAQAFFDGFDIFSQFNDGYQNFGEITRNHAHQLERDLREVLDRSGDAVGAEDVELFEPEERPEIPIPGFTHHEGFPGGFFNMFSHGVRGGSKGPWWKGENVCVEREEIDESSQRNATSPSSSDEFSDEEAGFVGGMFGSFEFSSCSQTDTKYTCTTRVGSRGVNKKFVVKYQCCHGYSRRRGQEGCTPANLKGLLETAKELGANDFVKVVKTAGLEEKFNTENITLFAPTSDALRDFMDKMQQENQVEFFIPPAKERRRRRNVETADMKDIALGHSTHGFVDISELVNEQILYSENNNSTMRINVYPTLGEARVTCNCARVTSVNNMATNGVVHLVDQVMRPVTKTIVELLEEDEQLATLTDMLKRAGMLGKLKEAGHVTLFAPTEDAFRKLPEATMSRLRDGHACLKRVLQHHLLPHVLCSAAVNGHVATHNVAGDVLHLERRLDDNKLFLENVQIVIRDVVATNGVIHVVDDIIVPDSAKPISEVLRANNHTAFLDLLASSSLLEELDAMENVTVFAPTDKALRDEELVKELRDDEDKLREVLLYHTTQPEKMSCDLGNNMMLETNAGEGKSLMINLYASQPMFLGVRHRATAQCARLVGVDTRACGGVIHTVDRLIVPPTKSVMEIVKGEKRFSSLLTLIKAADMENVLDEMSPITLLAPTNEAFDRIGEEGLQKLLEDKEKCKKVLGQHILPEALCCAGVSANSWPFTNRVETLNNDSVTVRRDSDGEVHVGTTTVRECDKMATNGLVHVVNRVMGRWRNGGNNNNYNNNQGLSSRIHPNLQIMLYGLQNLGL